MLPSNLLLLLLSLTIILLLSIKSSNATVSCTYCTMPIYINLTSDTDINIHGCTLLDTQVCTLKLRIDYTNRANNFALLDGVEDAGLILTNGEPEVTETTYIWFDEVGLQRLANIVCFSAASCGLDLIQQIYRDNFRLFNYTAIQSKLSEQLYSAKAPSSNLTCADASGASLSCSDGFCRVIFDGNGFLIYSNCVKKGFVSTSYGLTVSKTTLADLNEEQASISFTCNKPMCNSRENTQQVLQQLVQAGIIPDPLSTTTTTVTASTTTKTITTATTTKVTISTSSTIISTTVPSMGIPMINPEHKFLIFLVLLFPLFKFI